MSFPTTLGLATKNKVRINVDADVCIAVNCLADQVPSRHLLKILSPKTGNIYPSIFAMLVDCCMAGRTPWGFHVE